MTAWLKQSTATTVVLGVFVDSVDGNTEETGLTVSQADIRLSKNGGAYAQTNNSAGATHMEGGDYGVPLDTTDVNTLGRLRVRIHESGALPVWRDFMVVPAQVWDSLFGADKLQVHADEITAGLLTDAAFAADAITAAKLGADVTTELQAGLATAAAVAGLNNLSAAQVNSEVDSALAEYDAPTRAELTSDIASLATFIDTEVAAILVDTGTDIPATLATIAGYLDTEVAATLTAVDTEVAAIKVVTDALTSAGAAKLALSAGTIVIGAAAAGTLSTTAMTTNLTESTDDHYNGRIIIWTSGVLINQATDITDYNGTTKTLTFTAVTEAPTAADTFLII